jgi:hypothetical protein
LRRVQLAKSAEAATGRDRQLDTWVIGVGQVFDPNPVVALQDESLRDHGDAYQAVPDEAYRSVDLRRLNHSHTLTGRWARLVNQHLATSATNSYLFKRANGWFEQVSAYHAIDTEQAYLRRLGLYHVNSESQDLKTDAFAADNSYYDPSRDRIWFGRGGVDDAEDPEVAWHEYGHAIQDDQVPSFGLSLDAAAIGEGFGDYMAAVMSLQAPDPMRTTTTPSACVMDWDSTAYSTDEPHCIRRTDLELSYLRDRTFEPHGDGEIWSRALWQMSNRLGPDIATRIIIEAQFAFTPIISMPKAARTTVKTAKALYGKDPTIAARTRHAFQARDILP